MVHAKGPELAFKNSKSDRGASGRRWERKLKASTTNDTKTNCNRRVRGPRALSTSILSHGES